MSLEHNKDLVERFFDFLNTKEHVNAVLELVDDHCGINGEPSNVQALQNFILMMRTAFPDEQLTVETLLAEDDFVAARVTSRGTHQGAWCSPVGVIQPTGKQFTQTGMHLFRVRGAQIVEIWTEWNVLGMLQQLDVLPGRNLVEVGD